MTQRTFPLTLYVAPLVAAFMLPNLATPLMELWRDEIGFSSGTLTVIFVMYLGGLAPAFLIAPGLSAAWGRRKTQELAVLLGVFSCLFYILGQNVGLLLVARILTGFCSGILLVLGPSAIQAMASEGEKAKATITATLGIAVGLAGGPLFAGVIAQYLPWPTKTVFALMALLLLGSLAIIRTEQETVPEKVKSWLPFSNLEARDKRVVLAGLAAFGPGMTAAAILLALSPTLLEAINGPSGPLGAGLLAGGMYAVSPVGQSLTRRLPSLAQLKLSQLVIAISMVCFAIGLVRHNLSLLILSAVLIGAGQGVSNLGSFGLIHREVSPSVVPGATAALSLGTYVSASVVPLVGGFITDLQGVEAASVWMSLGVLVMLAMGLKFTNARYIGPSEE